jgi:hypothetical protein
MQAGFGVGGRQAALPPPPPGNLMERLTKAMEALASRYVLPYTLRTTRLNFAADGDTRLLDSQTNDITTVTVQVFSGTVQFLFGQFEGGATVDIPDFELSAIGAPINIPVPTHPFKLTAIAKGGAAKAVAHMHSGS